MPGAESPGLPLRLQQQKLAHDTGVDFYTVLEENKRRLSSAVDEIGRADPKLKTFRHAAEKPITVKVEVQTAV